jgi:hypothetical protein
LVELHERIRVEPVTARTWTTVDHDDVGIAVLDQRVDEGHAHGTGTHDEVVGLDL